MKTVEVVMSVRLMVPVKFTIELLEDEWQPTDAIEITRVEDGASTMVTGSVREVTESMEEGEWAELDKLIAAKLAKKGVYGMKIGDIVRIVPRLCLGGEGVNRGEVVRLSEDGKMVFVRWDDIGEDNEPYGTEQADFQEIEVIK